MINAKQIHAARVLLDWTQDDLARACQLSRGTLNNIERGLGTPRHSTLDTIEGILRAAGIDFLDHSGVRLKAEEIISFNGDNPHREFLDYVAPHARDIVFYGTVDDAVREAAAAHGQMNFTFIPAAGEQAGGEQIMWLAGERLAMTARRTPSFALIALHNPEIAALMRRLVGANG